ncbi:aminotransferase class V-fold PLP-dependent enzyme [Candidatus Pelagibacter sp.]|nr:aminotransferase class V-fold PLP-dependent enzyme [Candidatus Pelagibacter sp.]
MIYQIKPVFSKKDKQDLINYIKEDNWITEHKITEKFEKSFSKFTNSKHCICFPNGTITMSSVLHCLNLKKDDEVLVSNYTMVATANVAKFVGIKVGLVDISHEDLCMCPDDLQKKINKKTKVVIYTQMNGRVGKINHIKKICKKNKITLIEDSAHAIGSYYKKNHVGNSGLAGSFSFSMPKLITMGQGGAIITNSNKLANKLRLYKNFGRKKSGEDRHDYIGYNFKITDMQSMLALSQLKSIKLRIKKKKEIFERYKNKLKNNLMIKFFDIKKNETPWSVDIYLKDVKKLKKILEKNKIFTRYVYPPLNSQKIYNHLKNLPVSSFYCKRGLWLPSSLDITNRDIDKICKLINKNIN